MTKTTYYYFAFDSLEAFEQGQRTFERLGYEPYFAVEDNRTLSTEYDGYSVSFFNTLTRDGVAFRFYTNESY